MNINKPCKLCSSKRFANTSWCYKHYREREKAKKEEKAKKKLERHINTKAYQKEIKKKLIKKCDRLFQEIGRKMYDHSFFGNEYNCLHHFVRKSQSLNLRYDFDNAIPVSLEEHCSIHMAQDNEIEGRIVLAKGKEWFNNLMIKRRTIIADELSFLKQTLERLENTLKQYD